MTTTETITSPITEQKDTRLFDKVEVEEILKLYKYDFKMDVSQYFKGLDAISIIECKATGYRFYYPPSTIGGGAFYEEFQEKNNVQNIDCYRTWGYDYQFAYDNIDKNELVLDLGCGAGAFLKKIKDKTPNAFGLELNSVACKTCNAAGLTVYNESIQEHAANNPGKYDVVCIFQVLEHVYEIKGFLEAAVKALRKGGKLIIGVPNNEPYFQGYDKYTSANLPPHHMGLWNKRSLTNIQSYFNIRLKKVSYDKKPQWLHDAYFRAKYWWGIKTNLKQHSLLEKIKIGLLAPISVPVSLYWHLKGRKNCGFIVAMYEKL